MEQNKIDAEHLWSVAWTYIQTVVDTAREPFLILDKDLRVVAANNIFYSVFQVEKRDTENKLVYELGNKQWNIPRLRILLEDILPKNSYFADFEVRHDFPEIGQKIMMLNARRVYHSEINKPIILLAMEDITKQVTLEQKLQTYTEELAARTKELEKRVMELETINKSMVNRELRMVELKKELEKLKKLVENVNSEKSK